MKISIVTPIYNEEKIVVQSVSKTQESVCSFGFDLEYIVVNDGSTDTSLTQLMINFDKPPFIILNKPNGGFGSAVKYAISMASGDYVLCVPADSPLDTATCKALLDPISSTSPDIIVSYRKEKVGYSRARRFNSTVYRKLVSLLFGIRLNDYNWIHIYRREAFQKLNITSDGVFMLAETIVKASRAKLSIVEVEVEQQQRIVGESTSTQASVILKTILELIWCRYGFSK